MTALALLVAILAFGAPPPPPPPPPFPSHPLSMLLYGSLHSTPPGMAGTFNLDGYRDVITLQSAVTLLNTVGISLAKTIPSVIAGRPACLDSGANRHAVPGRAGSPDHASILHSPDPDRDGVGHARQPAGRVAQSALSMGHGIETAPINVYSYGGVVWHMMQYSGAIPVSADRGRFPCDGSEPRRGGDDVRSCRARGPFAPSPCSLCRRRSIGAAILSFRRGIENFESPLFFGSPAGIRVITTGHL